MPAAIASRRQKWRLRSRTAGVAEVAVAEQQVRHDVSVIAAFVVPANDSNVGAEAILAYAARSLAPYKRPKEVVFLEKLPRGANGKLLRRLLGAR